ncbi:MAG: hypothetical protein ACXAC5_05400 [Promethearchaeota archaeon]|jgi:hypothetical protein
MGKRKRKEIIKKEKVGSIDRWSFEGSLDDIISMLQKIKYDNKQYHEISIEVDDGIYEGYIEFLLFGLRPENKEEREKRLKEVKRRREANKKAKEKLEAEEIKKLKELIEKYKDRL